MITEKQSKANNAYIVRHVRAVDALRARTERRRAAGTLGTHETDGKEDD